VPFPDQHSEKGKMRGEADSKNEPPSEDFLGGSFFAVRVWWEGEQNLSVASK